MAEAGWFAPLTRESLSGVGFFSDYVQLHFNLNPLLNVYTPIRVTMDGSSWKTGEAGFADALLGQMNKRVAKVMVEPERCISIHFKDDSVVSFETARNSAFPQSFTLFTNAGVFEE
jgi:hypothetical protein